jgi:hypothetical protein
MLSTIVSAHPTLAQVFYLVALIVAGLWVFGVLGKRTEPYWPVALPLTLFFIALGLFFTL